MTQSLKNRLPLIAMVIAAISAAVFLRDFLTFDTLRLHRNTLIELRDSHYFLTAAGYVAAYFAAVVVSLPGALFLTLAGGFVFGLWAGTAWTVLGASLGAMGVFWVARLGLGAQMAARMDSADGNLGRIKRGLDENQWSMLFLIRLVPVVPFFLANLAPAFLGVPFRRFAISTILGIVPGTFVYTSVGAGLGVTFDQGGRPDLGTLFQPHILGPIVGLCALAALPILLNALRGQKGTL